MQPRWGCVQTCAHSATTSDRSTVGTDFGRCPPSVDHDRHKKKTMNTNTTTVRIHVQNTGTNFGAIAYVTPVRSRRRLYESSVRSQRYLAYADAEAVCQARGWRIAEVSR